MKKLKVAVIGCGGIANQKHFPALKNNSDMNEIVAFCDVIEERAVKAAKEFGTPDAKVFYKLGGLQQATEGNLFGPWDPKTYEVEDSAMGFIKMKNGATINLEASWALNILESREASTTLCGTEAGAEIHSGMSYSKNELIYNRGRNNQLMEETLSPVGGVAYFGGGGGEEGTIDCKQWLNAVATGTEPLVKPEEALAVTKILDAIYKSAKENREIKF